MTISGLLDDAEGSRRAILVDIGCSLPVHSKGTGGPVLAKLLNHDSFQLLSSEGRSVPRTAMVAPTIGGCSVFASDASRR